MASSLLGLIAAFSAVFAITSAALPKAKKLSFLQECEKIHQTGLDLNEILDKWLIPESEKGQCLMECFVLKKGLIDKYAKIDHSTATPHFKESFPDDEESVKKAEQSLKACDYLDTDPEISKLGHCAKAVEVLKCFRKKAKEVHLKH